MAEAASAVDAGRSAVEVQRAMAEQNAGVPQEVRIEFRIGINLGDVIVEDGKLLGSSSDGRWLKRKVASDVLARPVV